MCFQGYTMKNKKTEVMIQNIVEIIKNLAHQINKKYLNLSKRLIKVEERFDKGTEEMVYKEFEIARTKTECMDITTKVVLMYTIRNLVPRKETKGRKDAR